MGAVLGGGSTVQLASLLAVGADSTIFAVRDQRLRAAAAAGGVALAPAD